jgi:hypothetical protein
MIPVVGHNMQLTKYLLRKVGALVKNVVELLLNSFFLYIGSLNVFFINSSINYYCF